MAIRIQFRRDTAANWTSVNPILAQGELGLETDTGKCKIGDGTSAWTALLYGLGTGIFTDAEGRVGIGTTTPGTLLELANVAGVVGKGQLFINGLNSANDGLYVGIVANEYGFFNFKDGVATIGSRGGAATHGYFRFLSYNGTDYVNRLVISATGDVAIGVDNATSKLQVVGLAEYADNAAAVAGGLTVGAFYRTGDLLKVVHD